MTALEFFRQKQPMPTELRTAELTALPREMRERAFFMAAVTEAEILDLYSNVTERVLSGEWSVAEGRRALREGLDALGYLPDPGDEGTIQDLRSQRRMNVVLETNLSLSRNFAGEEKQWKAAVAFPIKKLVRLQEKLEKRDWPNIWSQAYATLPTEEQAGVSLEPPAALLGNGIWTAISDFRNPYAPFKWGSGMGNIPGSRTEAKTLGIQPLKPTRPQPGVQTYNATVQATPRVKRPEVKAALTNRLADVAAWSGDVLMMRPMLERLAKMLVKFNPNADATALAMATKALFEGKAETKGKQLRVTVAGKEVLLNWDGGGLS